ncbi:MAG: hypothetical protein UT13_C0001G0789 [Candidatus Pacebacteria bacterium GW2011_GWF2_38_9]|nr:MAG: hypothetical protein US01_C0001G0825 [candidate division TM6 bacterium GW2011_GWF2_28_16]KKQ08081.1 MAG: hypothetical protein US20_C0024G0005 [Candidatus Pacebacteria bacterium GW2011_GWF1_36_5]KKQ89141.1 MAG: hypothetical protein UT13_C0001G0789 [Candidatus Pacebacteria bacterium GW2011_GWF2_38_9]MBU1034090.1 hypothetical protein [Patescibacteria group bacterium]
MEEKIIIPVDTSINDGDHEDGDSFILTEELEAKVIGVLEGSGSLRVIIPKIDPDRVFFIHQAPKQN